MIHVSTPRTRRTTCVVGLAGAGLALAFFAGGCSTSSGGSGGGTSNGNSNSNSNGTSEFDECDAPVSEQSCDAEAPLSTGALELPHSEDIPLEEIPSVVLAAGLPEVADLSDLLPTPCNQGARNTCVGWAGGYALMSYLAADNIDGWNDLSK